MRKSTHDKLNSLGTTTPFTEPHESYTRTLDGASSVTTDNKPQKSKSLSNHPGKNLGQYLHPKRGSIHGRALPADEVHHTVDAHTGGKPVRPGF